jgi:hypothetical protein
MACSNLANSASDFVWGTIQKGLEAGGRIHFFPLRINYSWWYILCSAVSVIPQDDFTVYKATSYYTKENEVPYLYHY